MARHIVQKISNVGATNNTQQRTRSTQPPNNTQQATNNKRQTLNNKQHTANNKQQTTNTKQRNPNARARNTNSATQNSANNKHKQRLMRCMQGTGTGASPGWLAMASADQPRKGQGPRPKLWPDWAYAGQPRLAKTRVGQLLAFLGKRWPARAGQSRDWPTLICLG